jgi:subtilase family serine protease
MTKMIQRTVATLGVLACALTFNVVSQGQAAVSSKPISSGNLVTLEGNTPAVARKAAYDRGMVPDNQPMDQMEVLLRRPAAEEASLQKLIEQQHRPGNPSYHKWLTADQFAQRFGVPEGNVSTVKEWLQSQGFHIDGVQQSGLIIMFSGTAGMVREAFHTEIHNIQLKNGDEHVSNVSDPKVPANIAELVVGPVSLGNFIGHPLSHHIASAQIKDGKVIKPEGPQTPRGEYTFTSSGDTYYALVAGDVATIYNLNPLFTAGYTGKGTTIAVVEDSTMYTVNDWNTFISTFGLSGYGGTLTQTHPSGSLTCTAPTDNADDSEVEIDAEYASAAAPGATINVASCKDGSTNATFGGLIAVQNLTTAATPPPIISMSYGECEAENGQTNNKAFSTAFQQAAAQGISVFVSSGDDGAVGCDRDATAATHGLGVTGWGESPYNVSVGGTDFYDGYLGNESTYWNSTNSASYNSALSYIPEIPWNDSCASQLIANVLFAAGGTGAPTSANTYGTNGSCNSSAGEANFLNDSGGSGGPSGCYSGTASTSEVVSGTCAGIAKPSWQSVYGNPADGVRDVPDVSLFAANGVWGHYYVVCYSHPGRQYGGVACTGAPSGWSGFGGTSVSSPIMAGIQALIDQYVGTTTNGVGAKQGNPNYVYYALANSEYGASGSSTCNSDSSPASSCVFYDVTAGDNNMPCTGSHNCYKPSGTYGVGSLTTSSYSPIYATASGWDFATGIGSVNAYNLALAWANAFPTTTALTATPSTVASGGTTVLKATVSAATLDNATSGGTQVPIAGTITFKDGTSTLATCTLSSATCSSTINYSQLTVGGNNITAVYSGSNAYPGSTSSIVVVTATAATYDIKFSSVTHNFGDIAVGSATSGSGNYGVQLTNNDTTAFPFSLTIAGSTAFTENTNCGTSVAAGKSCEIIFTFSPTASGTATATWSVGANGKTFTPSNGGTLTGIGLTGTVSLYTAGHNFGKVTDGTQSPTYGTVLTNGTASAVTLTLGSVTSPFITTANNCPATLASGASCNLQFAFKPTATTTTSQTFTVKANGGAIPIVTGSPATTVTGVTLVGTGQ